MAIKEVFSQWLNQLMIHIFFGLVQKKRCNFHKRILFNKKFKKNYKKNEFIIKVNHNFKSVILCCSQKNEKRTNTWINNQIIDNYTKLFEKGLAKSVECYHENKLVGGLYGVKIGSIFLVKVCLVINPMLVKLP